MNAWTGCCNPSALQSANRGFTRPALLLLRAGYTHVPYNAPKIKNGMVNYCQVLLETITENTAEFPTQTLNHILG